MIDVGVPSPIVACATPGQVVLEGITKVAVCQPGQQARKNGSSVVSAYAPALAPWHRSIYQIHPIFPHVEFGNGVYHSNRNLMKKNQT